MNKTRLGIFASGTGSNALNLIRYFENHPTIEVGLVLSNKADAPVLEAAQKLGVEVLHKENAAVADGYLLLEVCREHRLDWIMLAGYLRLIPSELIQSFPNRILNLHPSLLPKYGGKGMHGMHVHQAVIENGESESGITIHFVNEEFDKGQIVAQFRCMLNSDDTVQTLANKIHILEQSYLPVVVEKTIQNGY